MFAVVVDLSDPDCIELAGTWRQDFLSKASRTVEQIETLPNGVQTVRQEPVKGFDPRSVPMILLGNKYDLVGLMANTDTLYSFRGYQCS